MSMSNGLSSLLWFCVIVALIPATLWFLKRTPLGGAGGAGVMKSIASLPLSTSQRIVTVEVGTGDERRWLVIGVTPQSITTLHSMAAQDLPTTPTMAAPSFAPLLARLRRDRSNDDAR